MVISSILQLNPSFFKLRTRLFQMRTILVPLHLQLQLKWSNGVRKDPLESSTILLFIYRGVHSVWHNFKSCLVVETFHETIQHVGIHGIRWSILQFNLKMPLDYFVYSIKTTNLICYRL